MKKLIALRGSEIGSHFHKIYELIYYNDLIYVFITYSYDNSLTIEEIEEKGHHIGGNIFKKVIEDPFQFDYYNYETFASIWRAVILKDHEFESDKYYLHLLQIKEENLNQVESIKKGTKRALNLLAEHLADQDYGFLSNQIHLG